MSSLPSHDAAHMAPFFSQTDAGYGDQYAPRGKSAGDRVAETPQLRPVRSQCRRLIAPYTKLRPPALAVMLLTVYGDG